MGQIGAQDYQIIKIARLSLQPCFLLQDFTCELKTFFIGKHNNGLVYKNIHRHENNGNCLELLTVIIIIALVRLPVEIAMMTRSIEEEHVLIS